MIFTLSSAPFPFVSMSVTEYGEPHLPAIHRSTFEAANTSLSAQRSRGIGNVCDNLAERLPA